MTNEQLKAFANREDNIKLLDEAYDHLQRIVNIKETVCKGVTLVGIAEQEYDNLGPLDLETHIKYLCYVIKMQEAQINALNNDMNKVFEFISSVERIDEQQST